MLADAARRVASPQIRNSGTIGGNVCQDARCWYYRYGVNCYRAGGNRCYADTPEGQNREHCLWGADRCIAVSPSDTAPALVALDAKMVVLGPKGERVVGAEDFFIGPNVDITRMTSLEKGDVLTAIRLPAEWSGARFYFEKVADRNTWDFALVNIAAAMVVSGAAGSEKIEKIRIAAGAVQCVPRRLTAVEQVVDRPAEDRRYGLARRPQRGERRDAAQLQPLQDPAAAEPRHARDPRRVAERAAVVRETFAGGAVQDQPRRLRPRSAARSVVGLDLCLLRGRRRADRRARALPLLPCAETTIISRREHSDLSPRACRRCARQSRPPRICGSRLPLAHGRERARAARDGVSTDPRCQVRLGHDPLDRRARADRRRVVSHGPRVCSGRIGAR